LGVCALVARDPRELRDPRRLLPVLGAALAPDLDLLLRFVDGRQHHQQESHSLGLALLAGAAAALVAWAARWPRPGRLGMVVALGWASHVLLDYLSADTSAPVGLMALWPLSRDYFKVPWPLFLDIWRRLDLAGLQHNLVAVAWEAVLLAPPLLLVWRRRSEGRD
jgi:inner membrane protein